MGEHSTLARLDAWPPYVRLNQKLEFVKRYWYGMAAGQLLLFVILVSRFFSKASGATFSLASIVFYLMAVWAFLVVGYGLTLMIRLQFIGNCQAESGSSSTSLVFAPISVLRTYFSLYPFK